MNASFTCKCAAAALTFMSLAQRGIPPHIIASIPFPYLPGPPRTSLSNHNSYLDAAHSEPSAGLLQDRAMDATT